MIERDDELQSCGDITIAPLVDLAKHKTIKSLMIATRGLGKMKRNALAREWLKLHGDKNGDQFNEWRNRQFNRENK